MQLNTVLQSSTPGSPIALFRLDTTTIGGSVMYFCHASRQKDADGNVIPAESVVYNGITYTPTDLEFEGFETSATGALPTPRLTLVNINGLWQAIINTYGDLTGCEIRRIRTFERFLDGQPDADPAAYMGPDVFRIDRKTAENNTTISWELSAAIDQEGKKLPGRVVIRDTCLSRYRRWDVNTSSFDYTLAQCPYAGSLYFDVNDDPVVSAALDRPSRTLSCCKTRFGSDVSLPFGGFPGAARLNT